MEKVLAIDAGTHSIGWAIREINSSLDNQIIDHGVMTFDKGVAEDQSGEHPMVQQRTESRGKRRNYQAKKYRKWALLQCLIENNMCPLTPDELNGWRYYKKDVGRKYPQSEKFIQWLRFDFDGDGKPDFERLGFSKNESCYLFRELVVDETKVLLFKQEPYIVGRVLYQMVQRRGYKDYGDLDESAREELSKTIRKGNPQLGTVGSDEIIPYLQSYKTLGAALYHLQKEKNVRIRKRYSLRSQYEQELKEICRVQQIDNLYKQLWGAMMWQRPLKSQKGSVGMCTFEPNKRRCPMSHPLYEEFKTWVFINNLKIKPVVEDLSKTPVQRQAELTGVLWDKVYPQFFKAASDFKLSSIAKELKKVNYKITGRFSKDTKVVSFSFIYKMKDIFGDQWALKTGWNDLLLGKSKSTRYSIEDLWHLHFTKHDNKLSGESSTSFLLEYAKEKLGLDEKKSESFAQIRLNKGYATLSLSAIKKILPYLHKGFNYSEAVYLANLYRVLGVVNLSDQVVEYFAKGVRLIKRQHEMEQKLVQAVNELIIHQLNSSTRFGMDSSYTLDDDDRKDVLNKLIEIFGQYSWAGLNEDERNEAQKFVSDKYAVFLRTKVNSRVAFEKIHRLHDRIFQWISESYEVPNDRKKYLWHPSELEIYLPLKEIEGKRFLGNPEPIGRGFKNPMALKTLYKIRKLINYLIDVGKVDSDTRVVVELARELNDANRRKAIARWQKERENQNADFKKRIDEINSETNANYDREDERLIERIRLWEEQNRMCLYTGKTITLSEVLRGSKYDMEHTVPYSMSRDNELKNLTLADKKYNQQIKAKRIPSECPNYDREITLDGIVYPAILTTIQNVFGRMTEVETQTKGGTVITRKFKKISDLEKELDEWKLKTSEQKEIRDAIIARRHYIKMHLDYWRYKLNTFLLREYKSGWRNSQLKDTQLITKYALPYLKTVFKRVEVQKGSITSEFRKIYKVQNRLEKKDRTRHSHHAIDAAILTLIPPAAVRDKVLLRYNEAQDNGIKYHEKPLYWEKFQPHHVLNLHDQILVNYQSQDRTLIPAFRNVRKRGKIQFVQENVEDGHLQYKLDQDGTKIRLIARGDSIRGQLHMDSFLGKIRIGSDLTMVKRYPLSSFTSIKNCDGIVDPAVREIVTRAFEERLQSGMTFKEAKLQPVYFPNGKTVIKKVRCKVSSGGGHLTTKKALTIKKHSHMSKHEHKQYVYAQNEKNVYCLFYELQVEGVVRRAFRLISFFQLAKLRFKTENQFFDNESYKTLEERRGEHTTVLPLSCIIKVGTKVFFYDNNINDLQVLSKKDLYKRLFRVYKFNGPPDYLFCQHHSEASKNEALGKGDSDLDLTRYQGRVFLTAAKFKAAIEGRDFEVKPDGEIVWLKN